MTFSVLVVDDDAAFRGLASRMLTGLGLNVVGEVGSVAAAHTAAAELRPDGALVDVGLPDGDGLVLARHIAALPWGPRVVITSSDADAATTAVAHNAGAVGFIAKADLPNGTLRALLTGE
jgi:CheY-like chemotaxis protein